MIQSDRIATRRLRRRSRKMKSSKYVSRHYGSYIHTRRVAQARHFCRYHHSLEPVFCVPRLPIVARGVINRYYDPSTGQFLSVDPLVAYTNLPYSYAGDNPINFNDPFGLCGCHTGFESILNLNPFSPCNPIRQSVEHGGWWSRHGQLNPAYWAISGYYNEFQCSEAGGGYSCLKYGAEGVAGVAGTLGVGIGIEASLDGWFIRGGEFRFGPNFRINPTGDWNSNNPYARWPHYHRRGPGGIGKHRPWER